jgi:hypothetical protein
LAKLALGGALKEQIAGQKPVLWTDDYNNILAVLKAVGE